MQISREITITNLIDVTCSARSLALINLCSRSASPASESRPVNTGNIFKPNCYVKLQ